MCYHRGMDINLIALNLGNSRLAIGVFHAGELVHTQRLGMDQQSEWVPAIRQAWAKIAPLPNASVTGASVNPPLEAAIEKVVHEVCDRQVQWAGRQIDLPIDVLTEPPQQTGVDRVLNVAAAFEQLQKACIVVDAGTAITLNCCNEAGDFVGGAIAPGIGLMLDALHEKTAGLPKIAFEVPTEVFGRSTAEAMRRGVYDAIRGLVKEFAEGYATRLGEWPEIIATGGDAQKLFADWELIHAISPDLTLYGVALAYTEHHIKHGT